MVAGVRTSASEMDVAVKVLIVVLVILFSYLIAFIILAPFLTPQPTSWPSMMQNMMGSSQTGIINLVALLLALTAGLAVLLLMWKPATAVTPVEKAGGTKQLDELSIIKKALSEDEKAVIEEIRKAGEITQDSLRFRLDWSKAKLSRILTNLDKMNIIQRERIGKTYNVFLTEKKRSADS